MTVASVPSGGWVLWAGTLGFATPVLDRLDAASHIDVQRFSITPIDVEWASQRGISASELGRRVRAAGYDVIVDPVVGWYGGTPHPRSTFGRFGPESTIDMAAELGAVALNLIGHPTHDGLDASLDRLATRFAHVCDRAAEFGAQAHLEFTPITAIADLAAGWEIVRTAARSNGGLLFDTWHFAKGTPDLELLARIPGDKIFSVQVADVRSIALTDLRQDTMHRDLPGDGVADLTAMLRTLHGIDALSWVGAEVFSPGLLALPTEQAARLADARTREIVTRALDAGTDRHRVAP